MKSLRRSRSIALLILSFFVLNTAEASKHHKQEVKYVQGGVCEGNGSKERPYNSLAAAEADTSWTKLVVLPSAIALDGGITLRSGTTLVGAKNPVDGPISNDQPTISNSSNEMNGGNGIVVQGGSVTIKNIQLKNLWASGVNYDNASNLTLENVIVTDYNHGKVTASFRNVTYYVGGIQAISTHSGTTHLHKVVVKDNFAGYGFAEQIFNGAHRTVKATDCEMSGLGQLFFDSENVNNRVTGMNILAQGVGTKHDVSIKRCFFHDFNPASLAANHVGYDMRLLDGATANYIVDESGTLNLFTPTVSGGAMLVYATSGVGFEKARYHAVVKNSSFIDRFGENDTVGVVGRYANADTTFEVLNNTILGFYDSVTTYIGDDSINTTHVIGNNAAGGETFFTTLGIAAFGPSNNNRQKILVKNNTYQGGFDFGALGVISNYLQQATPVVNTTWSDLCMVAKNNCFEGGFAGLIGFDWQQSVGAGNATIKAYKNNIVDYVFDIFDLGANVNYCAHKNWWGQGAACVTGVDCADTQVCNKGFCVGPDNILNLGTGFVNVSDSLAAPITCPLRCPCSVPGDVFQKKGKTQTKEEIRKRFTTKQALLL